MLTRKKKYIYSYIRKKESESQVCQVRLKKYIEILKNEKSFLMFDGESNTYVTEALKATKVHKKISITM